MTDKKIFIATTYLGSAYIFTCILCRWSFRTCVE